MPLTSRRRLAAVAAIASLGVGAGVSATPAAAQDSAPVQSSLLGVLDPVLDPVLDTVLDDVAGMTPPEIQDALAPLTSVEIGQLLDGATPEQLAALLSGMTSADLTAALGGLDALDHAELLNTAGPAELTALLGALTPAQLTDALALLDAAALTGLLATATGALTGASGSDATNLETLIERITVLLVPATAPPAAAAPAPAGAAARQPARPALTAAQLAELMRTNYRARVSSVRVSRNRRSARVRVTCAATAPLGCLVRVTGLVAGKSAATPKWVLLRKGVSQTVTMKLKAPAAKRLRSRGGAVRFTARTVRSTLGSASRTTRVKKPQRAKR